LLTATPCALAGAAEDREVLTAELLHPPTAMSTLATVKPAAMALRASLPEPAPQQRGGSGPDRRGDHRDRLDIALPEAFRTVQFRAVPPISVSQRLGPDRLELLGRAQDH
jgi:hypothetical protein